MKKSVIAVLLILLCALIAVFPLVMVKNSEFGIFCCKTFDPF